MADITWNAPIVTRIAIACSGARGYCVLRLDAAVVERDMPAALAALAAIRAALGG